MVGIFLRMLNGRLCSLAGMTTDANKHVCRLRTHSEGKASGSGAVGPACCPLNQTYRPRKLRALQKPYLLTHEAPSGDCVIAAPRHPHCDARASLPPPSPRDTLLPHDPPFHPASEPLCSTAGIHPPLYIRTRGRQARRPERQRRRRRATTTRWATRHQHEPAAAVSKMVPARGRMPERPWQPVLRPPANRTT